MWQDPIVAEIRQIRQAHAAQFEFDLKVIYEAIKEQEKQGHRKKVSFSPRRTSAVSEAGQAAAAQ